MENLINIEIKHKGNIVKSFHINEEIYNHLLENHPNTTKEEVINICVFDFKRTLEKYLK